MHLEHELCCSMLHITSVATWTVGHMNCPGANAEAEKRQTVGSGQVGGSYIGERHRFAGRPNRHRRTRRPTGLTSCVNSPIDMFGLTQAGLKE